MRECLLRGNEGSSALAPGPRAHSIDLGMGEVVFISGDYTKERVKSLIFSRGLAGPLDTVLHVER